MQIAVEKLGNLKRRLKITVPAEQIDQEVTVRLKKRAQNAKLKGFRPGKVPLDMVKRHFGDSVRQEVIGELIRTTFYEAITKENLNIAGMPEIEPKVLKEGAPLEYEATFEVYPEVTFHDLTDVPIEKWVAEITEQDLDHVLEKLQKQYIDWVEVPRQAQSGDRVIIDFEGTIDGEKFAGGEAKNAGVVLGSHSMIPGFEEGLIGIKAGENKELALDFPQDYAHKELAGKPAKFAIKVNRVLEPHLPPLDDAFATKLDVKAGVAELRNEVRKSMERELTRNIKENLKKQVLAELIKRNPIEIPAALVDAEIQQMQKQVKQRFAAQTGQNNLPDLPREHFEEQAKERVTVGLLLAEFIKNQQIKPDNARVRAVVEEIAAAYDNPEQVMSYYLQNDSILAQVESLVLEEQAVEKLLEKAKVKEKTVSYDEIVNQTK